jgi:hypothetical protein
LGAYPEWSARRSIVVMTSQPNQLLVGGRLEDRIRAASHRRLIRDLRRDSRQAARPAATHRRPFRRRGIASTPSA